MKLLFLLEPADLATGAVRREITASSPIELLGGILDAREAVRDERPDCAGVYLSVWVGGAWVCVDTLTPWPADDSDDWDQLAANGWRMGEREGRAL